MEHAKQVIFADYGVNVSLEAKNKDLLKFGRNRDMETAVATLMTLPNNIDNETYVATNIITTIVSDSASDTESVVIEGHTVSGSDFTFVTQTPTLNGTTPVLLVTGGSDLARCSRIYNNGTSDLVGTISVCETDTYTGTPGVPDTPAGVHCQIFAGKNQTEKASVTLDSTEYWVVTKIYCDMLTKLSSFAEIILEIRKFGKVFRQVATISCSASHPGLLEFQPYLIVSPNSDIRLRGVSDSALGRDVSGGIHGALLKA